MEILIINLSILKYLRFPSGISKCFLIVPENTESNGVKPFLRFFFILRGSSLSLENKGPLIRPKTVQFWY